MSSCDLNLTKVHTSLQVHVISHFQKFIVYLFIFLNKGPVHSVTVSLFFHNVRGSLLFLFLYQEHTVTIFLVFHLDGFLFQCWSYASLLYRLHIVHVSSLRAVFFSSCGIPYIHVNNRNGERRQKKNCARGIEQLSSHRVPEPLGEPQNSISPGQGFWFRTAAR